MKPNLLLTIIGLALFLGAGATSFASSVALQWDPNTETDLAGYKVYYKADSPDMPDDGFGAIEGATPLDVQNQTTTTVNGLEPGRTYYFAVTAYNTAGLESSYSNIVVEAIPLPDTSAPAVSAFTIPANSTSMNVPITAFSANDNVGVSGYLITPSAATIPAPNAPDWSAAAPTSYSFSSEGSKTLYAWAKDAAGNISNAIGRTVTITITQPGYSISDALQALRVSVGLIKPTSDQVKRLDVAPLLNGKVTPDGKINISDALMLLSKSVGLVSW
jgi:hypothetical protein